MSEFMVLGTDECETKKKLDLWLQQHPGIRINKIHSPNREPMRLLTRSGTGKPVGVSILIEFILPEAVECEKGIDISEQFNQLRKLRLQVYEAELDAYDKAMLKGS